MDCGQVGNYDYVYDIRFKLDGEIAVKVFMAGTVFSCCAVTLQG